MAMRCIPDLKDGTKFIPYGSGSLALQAEGASITYRILGGTAIAFPPKKSQVPGTFLEEPGYRDVDGRIRVGPSEKFRPFFYHTP